jgi:uncharacterized membrane protein
MEERDRQLLQELKADLAQIKKMRRPPRNVNAEFKGAFSPLERVAIYVTEHVGSFQFFLIIATWTLLWLGWNTLGPRGLRFDPAPAFVLWLFISNMIQIMLMPLIMVGQNLENRHDQLRAEADYEVNVRAEKELEIVLRILEHQLEEAIFQREMLRQLAAGLGPARGQETP